MLQERRVRKKIDGKRSVGIDRCGLGLVDPISYKKDLWNNLLYQMYMSSSKCLMA